MDKCCKNCRYNSIDYGVVCNFPLLPEKFHGEINENPTNTTEGEIHCERFEPIEK